MSWFIGNPFFKLVSFSSIAHVTWILYVMLGRIRKCCRQRESWWWRKYLKWDTKLEAACYLLLTLLQLQLRYITFMYVYLDSFCPTQHNIPKSVRNWECDTYAAFFLHSNWAKLRFKHLKIKSFIEFIYYHLRDCEDTNGCHSFY